MAEPITRPISAMAAFSSDNCLESSSLLLSACSTCSRSAASSSSCSFDSDKSAVPLAGLAGSVAPGKASAITSEKEQFLQAKLCEERIWDCTSLAEALLEAFGVRTGREALRMRLRSMGYRWKRTRCVPLPQARPPG